METLPVISPSLRDWMTFKPFLATLSRLISDARTFSNPSPVTAPEALSENSATASENTTSSDLTDTRSIKGKNKIIK